jgi:hypothetical protein
MSSVSPGSNRAFSNTEITNCEDNLRQGRRSDKIEIFRNWQTLHGGSYAILRVAATEDEGADLIADRPLVDLGAARDNNSRHFQPRDAARTLLAGVESLALLQIGAVYSGGMHLDQHFTGPGIRDRMAREFQPALRARIHDINDIHLCG